jgi:hypothetical protein
VVRKPSRPDRQHAEPPRFRILLAAGGQQLQTETDGEGRQAPFEAIGKRLGSSSASSLAYNRVDEVMISSTISRPFA